MPISRVASPGGRSPRPTSGAADTDLGPLDDELFNKLRALRKQLADDQGVPPYVVFGDKALRQMAQVNPTDDPAFLAISGVGQKKLEQYGAAFMAVIREHQA